MSKLIATYRRCLPTYVSQPSQLLARPDPATPCTTTVEILGHVQASHHPCGQQHKAEGQKHKSSRTSRSKSCQCANQWHTTHWLGTRKETSRQPSTRILGYKRLYVTWCEPCASHYCLADNNPRPFRILWIPAQQSLQDRPAAAHVRVHPVPLMTVRWLLGHVGLPCATPTDQTACTKGRT